MVESSQIFSNEKSKFGEVIIRSTKNTEWKFDPSDPDNEMNIMVASKDGSKIWPMQKLGKRIQNGNEDNVYHYTAFIVNGFNEESNKSSDQTNELSTKSQDIREKNTSKPWWKFW